jgi:hypothetical protein
MTPPSALSRGSQGEVNGEIHEHSCGQRSGHPRPAQPGTSAVNTIRAAARGAVAGAAGTATLNTITYLDMVWRARAASKTPEDTVERLAAITGVKIPGTEEERLNRIAGLGPLSGLVVGIGTGAALGLARAAGYRPGLMATSLTAAAAAMAGANVPMTALGITDPRTWSRIDWISDIVPHLAYGAVTGAALQAFDPGVHRQ